jgi:prophage regulatory protein
MSRRLLRLPEVTHRVGLGITQIYELQKRGAFPVSVPLGERIVGWVESEIEEWIAQRIALRDAQPPKHARSRKGGPGRGHKGPMVKSAEIEQVTT